MTQGFENLSAEEKLSLAIEYVSRNADLPEPLRQFLQTAGLYNLVVHPEGV